jgi:hypothetical protein
VSVSIAQGSGANNPVVLVGDLIIAYSTPMFSTTALALLLFSIIVVAVARIAS